MRRPLILIGLLIYGTSIPLAFAATGWNLLLDDLDAWNAELLRTDAERSDEAADLELERRGDPFPMPTEISGSGAIHKIVFRDVPPSAWFAPYVHSITQMQIVSGYRDTDGRALGEFRPANPVTLEELVKIAVTASGIAVD